MLFDMLEKCFGIDNVLLLSKFSLWNFVLKPEIFAFLHIRDLMLQFDAIAYWRFKKHHYCLYWRFNLLFVCCRVVWAYGKMGYCSIIIELLWPV